MPVSMQLLDLGLIVVGYKLVQHTQLRHHTVPLKSICIQTFLTSNEISVHMPNFLLGNSPNFGSFIVFKFEYSMRIILLNIFLGFPINKHQKGDPGNNLIDFYLLKHFVFA